MEILGKPVENPDHSVDKKLTVHLWDEVSGEWGEAYVDEPRGGNHIEIHDRVNNFIDHEPDPEDDIVRYMLDIDPGLSVNVGYFGRQMLWVELWGPQAETVKKNLNLMSPDGWYPEPCTPRQALAEVVRAHALTQKW